MVLYSIIDIADVLCENHNEAQCVLKQINGGFVELHSSTLSGENKVKRLYSTNPALYLDKRYYPF